MAAYLYLLLLPLKEYQAVLSSEPDEVGQKLMDDIDAKGFEFDMKEKFLSDDAKDYGDPKKEPKGALCLLFDRKTNSDKMLAWLHSEEARLHVDFNITPYAQEFSDPDDGSKTDDVKIETPKA
jgi:hypothetical protein